MEIVNRIKTNILQGLGKSGAAYPSIKIVYLFGSVLRQENFRPGSDVDMGFLIDRKLHGNDPLSASFEAYHLAAMVSRDLERQTDVVILNSASVEMAYQIITSGRVLYECDPDFRMEYEIAVKGMYFDFKPFIKKIRQERTRLARGAM